MYYRYVKINITVVRWMNKKEVHMISSYAGAEPIDEIVRYDKKEKTRIKVDRPFYIQEYNKFMGGSRFYGSSYIPLSTWF